VSGVNTYARIAFFFGKVEMARHTGEGLKLPGYIRSLRFDLLHAKTIRLQAVQPVLQPFAAGRAYAVEV
jgi:hypothetical protein